MRKTRIKDVKIGSLWRARVNGAFVTVRVEEIIKEVGYDGYDRRKLRLYNVTKGKPIRKLRTASFLRTPATEESPDKTTCKHEGPCVHQGVMGPEVYDPPADPPVPEHKPEEPPPSQQGGGNAAEEPFRRCATCNKADGLINMGNGEFRCQWHKDCPRPCPFSDKLQRMAKAMEDLWLTCPPMREAIERSVESILGVAAHVHRDAMRGLMRAFKGGES